jgi:hypothetical protein
MKAFLVERNRMWVALKNFPGTLLAVSFFYTMKRYFFQAYAVLSRKGASGKFVSQHSTLQLLGILVKAHVSAWSRIPVMLRKRRQIKKISRVSTQEIARWFRDFEISAAELSLKD